MWISTHSPRAGRTFPLSYFHYNTSDFNSLAPREANPITRQTLQTASSFQLTRPTRGEPIPLLLLYLFHKISTHSPHARRTNDHKRAMVECSHFNSLAPREANRLRLRRVVATVTFQLTRPTRGEPVAPLLKPRSVVISTHSPHARRTHFAHVAPRAQANFNSLAPREANPHHLGQNSAPDFISTHSPHARRTLEEILSVMKLTTFQLTRPTRGEPKLGNTNSERFYNFNSLAPREANLHYGGQDRRTCNFNSLAPREANRWCTMCPTRWRKISTHSPHARRTGQFRDEFAAFYNFNSLAPREANLLGCHYCRRMPQFQLTRPTRGEPAGNKR